MVAVFLPLARFIKLVPFGIVKPHNNNTSPLDQMLDNCNFLLAGLQANCLSQAAGLECIITPACHSPHCLRKTWWMILNLHFIIIIILQNWRVKYVLSVFLEPCLGLAETAYTHHFKLFYSIHFCCHLRSLFRFLSLKLISKYNTFGVIWISFMSLANSWFGSVSLLLSPVSHEF